MSGGHVHYELFARRTAAEGWSLQGAMEDRAAAMDEAQALVAQGRAVAARVVKEVLDAETGLFDSVVILTRGDPAPPRARRAAAAEESGALCTSPGDLYTAHARERIARVLHGWLMRRGVTAFELLHRPDLADDLDPACGELLGAIQKVAIPEAQSRGRPVHEVQRSYQSLAERTLARLAADAKRRAFPEIDPSNWAVAANRLTGRGDAGYLLGGGVAAHLADAKGWRAKVERLVELAEAAPAVGPARALALRVLEQPLCEILGGRAGLNDLAGAPLDLGGGLALLLRLAAGREAAVVEAADPALMRPVPALAGAAARLQALLGMEAFEGARAAAIRRVLAELNGPRRLRPADPEAEIELLRALAGVLGAVAGPRLPMDDIKAAFVERSRRLVAPDFVEALLAGRDSPMAEARALVRLAENVTGGANKRAAARWIDATLGALRFETALRRGPDAPGAKLAALADLQGALGAAGLSETEHAALSARLGEAGGWIEADARLVGQIARSPAPAMTRALVLLRMAVGEAAPLGPAADRAKGEALKLLRTPELRADAASHPESFARLRALAVAVAA